MKVNKMQINAGRSARAVFTLPSRSGNNNWLLELRGTGAVLSAAISGVLAPIERLSCAVPGAVVRS
jgi:hydroxymethylpyrimidine/phosphomethylpyrimidine kinase